MYIHLQNHILRYHYIFDLGSSLPASATCKCRKSWLLAEP